MGSALSPLDRRRWARMSTTAAKAPIDTAHRIQPHSGGRFLFSMARMTSSRMGTLPPWPMISRTMPWKARKAARVTTNDGIPSLATSVPMAVPMARPVSRETATASGHDQPQSVSRVASTAAQTPLANPADRSISPSSRTNTRPMAITTMGAPWVSRLAKLPSLRNTGRRIEKTITSTTRPRTAGREPMSPPRTRSR
jgi:hypothetical protein